MTKNRKTSSRAERADVRGRRVGITIVDYERLAGRGPKHVGEALMARHNVRMHNLMQLPMWYRVRAIESLGPIGLLDASHRSLGIPLVEPPAPSLVPGRGTWRGESIALLPPSDYYWPARWLAQQRSRGSNSSGGR